MNGDRVVLSLIGNYFQYFSTIKEYLYAQSWQLYCKNVVVQALQSLSLLYTSLHLYLKSFLIFGLPLTSLVFGYVAFLTSVCLSLRVGRILNGNQRCSVAMCGLDSVQEKISSSRVKVEASREEVVGGGESKINAVSALVRRNFREVWEKARPLPDLQNELITLKLYVEALGGSQTIHKAALLHNLIQLQFSVDCCVVAEDVDRPKLLDQVSAQIRKCENNITGQSSS